MTLQQLKDELVRTSAILDTAGADAEVQGYWAVRGELQRRVADSQTA